MFAINNNAQTSAGPDLPEVQTEAIGFQAIAGEKKLRLLPEPWPSNALPKPTSTLLSVASRNELLAAAGPQTLIIASTPAVREAFVKEGPAEGNVKSFTPQLSISVPRLSQVTFSSDESYLAICADDGGGLAVYDVPSLKQGNTQQAFQLPTNGAGVRALVPNPAPENGHVLAVVLTNGQLLLANLKDRQFAAASNGPVLRGGVSCISWSTKGKQLVVGLDDGTAVQMSPDGEVKAEIPRPPQLGGNHHVSAISWLANDLFLFIYNPTNSDFEGVPDSTFILVTRQPRTTNFTFQKLQDPCGTFGMNRCPPHHFLLRLRDFPPNLTDAILVSSTGSGDIGLFTCSSAPLSGEPAAANTANIYTTTSIADDARRAQLPVYDEMSDTSGSTDTSPIGIVLDLSCKDNVKRPIPAEEIESTSTPLPGLMALNNEGVLSTWWFVYSDSVRQGIAFPGLVVAPANQPQSQSQPQVRASSFGVAPQGQSNFAAPSLASSGTFGGTATSAFGTPSALGGNLGASKIPTASFGSAGIPATNKSPWGTPANGGAANGLGKPAFGSSTPLGGGGSAFGAAGGLGKTQSPWGAPNSLLASNSANSQPAKPFGNSSTASPFANLNQTPSSGTTDKPFSPFSASNASNASPFAAVGTQQTKSVFGSTTASTSAPSQSSVFGSSFGAPSTFGKTTSLWGTAGPSNKSVGSAPKSVFGAATPQDADSAMEEDTPTSEKPAPKPQGLFGVKSSSFQLESSFKGDGTAKDDLPKSAGSSFFGSAFGNALAETGPKAAPTIKQEPKSPPGIEVPPTPPASLPTKTGAPVTGGFVEGAGELKPFLPPTKKAQSPVGEPEVKPEPSLPSSQPAREASVEPEPAPLPPSPTPPKKQTEPEPAPLPPFPRPSASEAQEPVLSPAGSPPIDLGEASSSPFSSAESLQSGEEEGSEPEVARLPPDFIPTPSWNFPSSVPKSPAPISPSFTESPLTGSAATPSTLMKTQPSQTPASATKPPVLFAPPSNAQQSPRSPSPIRNRGPSNLRGLLSPPSPATSFSTTPAGPPPIKKLAPPVTKPQFRGSHSSTTQSGRRDIELQPEEFVDDSDEKIREELSQPIEPTRVLAPFLAHQDYVGRVGGEGVAAQAEKVYRDINSMIDTLGLNARSLTSFIKGQSELFPDGGRQRPDLEKDDDWCLLEIEDLAVIQKETLERLDAERPQDVKEKTAELKDMQKQLVKLRSRHHDLQRLIRARQSPPKDTSASAARGESLTSEQSTVLNDLRNEFSRFQKLLSDAEDAASLLKAKLASAQAERDGGSVSSNVPTVEAVVNTIAKMTRMIEEKSGDVDVLEAQMKKLKFQARRVREGTPTALDEALGRLSLGSGSGGREDSPFATPPSSRSKMAGRSTYQLTYSPDTSEDESPSHRRSLRSSRGASGRKVGPVTVTDEEVQAYVARQERRRKVMQLLKDKVREKGVRLTLGIGGQ